MIGTPPTPLPPPKKNMLLTGVRDDVSAKRMRIGTNTDIEYYIMRSVWRRRLSYQKVLKPSLLFAPPCIVSRSISTYGWCRDVNRREKKFWKLSSFLIYVPTDNERVLHMGTIYNYIYTTVDACGWSLQGELVVGTCTMYIMRRSPTGSVWTLKVWRWPPTTTKKKQKKCR